MAYRFAVTDQADEATLGAMLAPLVAYNDARAGPSQGQSLVVRLHDEAGTVIGGLSGYTGYGWLFTQSLVVPEGLRGRGVGTKLMHLAEDEALARGCRGAWLDTFEFQARGFYERLGYFCFGELKDYPTGFSRYFMKKSLVRSTP